MSPLLSQAATLAKPANLDKFSSINGNTGQLISVMKRNRQNAVLTVLGDSTGVPEDFVSNPRWVFLLTQYLAQQFPQYTVTYRMWNDTTQAYDPTMTIQTGTGSFKLDVYNGSRSGAGYDYSFVNSNLTRFQTMIPVTPTTVIVSYGYNAGTTTYSNYMTELTRWVLGYFPSAEYVVVSQPPKASTDADSANSLLRSGDVRAWALREGYGLIDVAQAFLDYAAANGGRWDALVKYDNIHPNSTGFGLWFEQVRRFFDPVTPAARAQIQQPKVDRIFVDPSRFTAGGGSPAITLSPAGIPKWDFPKGGTVNISAIVDIPPTWPTANVWLIWSTPGGTTNSVVFYVDQQALIANMAVAVSGATPTSFTAGNKMTLASITTSGTTRITNAFSNTRFSSGRPLVFQIRREGADASDTYASNGWIYGLLIEKGS